MSSTLQQGALERQIQNKQKGELLFKQLPWDFVRTHDGDWVMFHVESGSWVWATQCQFVVDYFHEVYGFHAQGYLRQVRVLL